SPMTRAEQVAALLSQSPLLEELRKTHDVEVYRFDDRLYRDDRISLPKRGVATPDSVERPAPDASDADPAAAEGERKETDWREFLQPTGTETRLGQALAQLIQDERNAPVSGVIVFTDGGQNAGLSADVAVQLAEEARLPIFTVGLGVDSAPTNIRVADLLAPERAYPGDRYTVTGLLQAQGMAGRVVAVQLLSRDAAANGQSGTGDLLETRQVTLGDGTEVLPVRFDIASEQIGRQTLVLRVENVADDRNPDDDLREVEVEVIDRKTRVLLLAGGPTREYQFLRNVLYRDSSVEVDILLQTAREGISQESDRILDDFPVTREEMFEYDCVVAFDPDWQQLAGPQVELLEKWVAEQGGGLVIVAGPVYTGRTVAGWVQDPAMTPIRALYPVEFARRFSGIDAAPHGSREPWPLEFTREGMEAEFLWLGDTEVASQETWRKFPGVYGYTPLRGAKEGAIVLARFSDPQTALAGEQPVYFAWHFYASGRVFYAGSGEMWRLRALDDRYFEQYYTKLIRHVSRGRLLRGSTRGVLLVARDRYLIGDTVEVQAYRLTNAQLDPLESPTVAMQVIAPGGRVQNVTLQADPARAGSFVGQFTVLQEGDYRLELPIPESDDERLTRRIMVRIPQLERENPQRNDALLERLAQGSRGDEGQSGVYYVGTAEVLAPPPGKPSVVELLKDRTRTSIIPVAPSQDWQLRFLAWMMALLCGLLFAEWLIRRLARLA
ncbi:MAG: VWA domain-containing protein, partial [Patescibacteria group bacterium]|nr:VWA domain-containing protein [Patescibacteria group bacterium]